MCHEEGAGEVVRSGFELLLEGSSGESKLSVASVQVEVCDHGDKSQKDKVVSEITALNSL